MGTISGTEEKIEIRYKGNENYLYHPQKKKRYSEEEKKGVSLNVTVKHDENMRLRFVAKVLLGTGSFLFGNRFKEHADHESLRKIMKWDLFDENGQVNDIPVGLMSEFSKVPEDSIKWDSVFKTMSRAIDGSCVMFVIFSNQIVGAVGLGGTYIWNIHIISKHHRI
jgi:hypothetical protein